MKKQTRESTPEYYNKYFGTPEKRKQIVTRIQARREMEKKGLVHKGDGKEVDHKKPISKGGGNEEGNLRVISRKANRSYRRDARNRPL